MAQFDISKSINTLKYGLFIFLASIPAFILAGIVSVIFGAILWDALTASDGGGGAGIMLLVGYLAIVFIWSLATIQILTFAVDCAVSDANLEGHVSLGYGGSWKTAINITTELAVLLVGLVVLMYVGGLVEVFALTLIGILMLSLMYMGLIPYVVRRTVET
jgi:hypothetical protein